MADDLVTYILRSREAGMRDEDISAALTSSGWSTNLVRAAFMQAGVPVSAATASPPPIEKPVTPANDPLNPYSQMISNYTSEDFPVITPEAPVTASELLAATEPSPSPSSFSPSLHTNSMGGSHRVRNILVVCGVVGIVMVGWLVSRSSGGITSIFQKKASAIPVASQSPLLAGYTLLGQNTLLETPNSISFRITSTQTISGNDLQKMIPTRRTSVRVEPSHYLVFVYYTVENTSNFAQSFYSSGDSTRVFSLIDSQGNTVNLTNTMTTDSFQGLSELLPHQKMSDALVFEVTSEYSDLSTIYLTIVEPSLPQKYYYAF
jgi:hypothetical protein